MVTESDYLAEVRRFHAEAVEPFKGKPVGCTEAEVAELESEIGFALPEAYRQFLLWMGRDFHGVFVGSSWFINEVVDNTRYLPDLLAENQIDFELPEHYLVFFGHQGYMAAWFKLPKEGEDPPCFFFTEAHETQPPRLEGTFTEFLLLDMKGLAQILPGLYGKAKPPNPPLNRREWEPPATVQRWIQKLRSFFAPLLR